MARLPVDRRARKYHHKSRPNEATNILSLPQEALLELGVYLNLPDLEALSATCHRLYEAFAKTLLKDQAFARENLRDFTLTTDEYGYHDFLLQILKREINPNYVKRFNCTETCYYYKPFTQEGEEIDVAQYIGWTLEDIQIVRTAIVRSPWLENIISPDELIAKMLNGDEEAVLVLLVPMLKNLSIFLVPRDASILQLVFVKIARAQIRAEIEHPEVRSRLPLRKLHTIFAAFQPGGISVSDTVHYVSLPSVRRVFIDLLNVPNPSKTGWVEPKKSSGIPRSRASVVYIINTSLWRQDVEVLAGYFTGPCTIRIYLWEAMPSEAEENESWIGDRFSVKGVVPKDPMSYYWDHCVITPNHSADMSSISHAGRASEDVDKSGNPKIECTIKYRNFHWEDTYLDTNWEEYQDAMRQAGIVPSPQWLALARWERRLNHPERLEDDSFTLED